MESVKITLALENLTEEEIATLYRVADEQGITAEKPSPEHPDKIGTADFGAVLILTGLVVGIGILMRKLAGGQYVDLREDPPKAWKDRGLDSKLMIVIGADGQVEVKANDAPDVLDDALKVVVELGKSALKTVDDIAAAVKKAVEGKAAVESKPS
ncbi:hypothetical protein [Rhodococcus sp. KRD162]|uniref:hypothetical protein n=1 Tax=Rhodococcus sp. KRD162 TaxID=2729725 RepID=UPI0019D2EBE1|nr:hypothetical protein [Rhodococcus sp. KRD162]